MIEFLLIISFLLHIITLVAIFQLVKQQQVPKDAPDTQAVMEIFEVYLEEMKEENKRLEKLVEKQHTHNEKTEESTINKKEAIKPDEELETLIKNTPQDEIKASLESSVLQLHTQGKSTEEIAKRLNCGKTEAELIIKLYRKR